MIKKYDSIILTEYKITFNPADLDEQNGITREIRMLLDKTFKKVFKKKAKTEQEIRALIEEYPQIPQFKNYLSVYYSNIGQLDKGFELNKQIVNEHPDYLFGKINLASQYLKEKHFKKVPEILGEAMEIKSLYPDREVFHIEEIMSFYKVAIDYFLETENIEAAEMRLKIMKDMDSDNTKTKYSEERINIYNLKKAFERLKLSNSKKRIPEFISKAKYKQTKSEPVFTNPEIKLLYQYSFQIDINFIKKLLELPRESLIEDLKNVVIDSIVRYKYFKNETKWEFNSHSFVFHALFMLHELKAEEALEVVLDLFRQNEKFLDHWFSDALTQDLWMVIFALGQNQFDKLRDYILEEGNYTYARTEISQAVLQTALYFPERRTEVIEWYYFVLNYFIEQKDNAQLIDTSLIGLMVCDVLDLKAFELEETIVKLYEDDLAEIGTAGDLAEVLDDLRNKNNKVDKRKYTPIEEIYKDYSEWEKSIERADEKKLYDEKNETSYPALPLEYKNVGRNEKCPCGSGLKFKKCHGK